MPLKYREEKDMQVPSTSSCPPQPSCQSQNHIRSLCSPFSCYVVQSIIGEGNYGKVLKCVKTATGETVAVKVMKKKTSIFLTEKEVSTMLILKNYDPDKFNFVKFNSVFVDKQFVCVEYELLDQSLFDFVMKRPNCCLSVKEIRPLLHQMATTLELLRSLDILHTDLKADNIMMVDQLNQPFRIKLIDFGLAGCVAEIESDMPYIQPLIYRAPEVMLGLPLTPATDIWSLGCIAAELFLGSPLYPGNCEYDILQLITQTQGRIPERLLNIAKDTRWFFRKRWKPRATNQWILNDPRVMGLKTRIKSRFESLDCLIKVRPLCHLLEEDNMTELEDRQLFINLLKRMLRVDYSNRITPRQIFQDPFITMNYLAEKYPYSFYMKSSFELMDVCRRRSVNPVQPSWSPLQSSTSTTSLEEFNTSNWVIPAWHWHQEHPVILQLAINFSKSLSLDEDHRPRCYQSGSQSVASNSLHRRKRKCRSPETDLSAAKMRRLDCIEENTQIAEATSSIDHNSRKRKIRRQEISLPQVKRRMIDETEMDTQTDFFQNLPADASASNYEPMEENTKKKKQKKQKRKKQRRIVEKTETETLTNCNEGSGTVDIYPECSDKKCLHLKNPRKNGGKKEVIGEGVPERPKVSRGKHLQRETVNKPHLLH
ncbi:homeodomain-interacting protein kinase 2-like isoform X2 [Paralichthys olivaceus]|uniref:homeodomain-interacting protein kinase 2-like isoform X2 n=1 Tax=Paralichthys olivaceus TaxID=8255 RepID=UPI003752BCD2